MRRSLNFNSYLTNKDKTTEVATNNIATTAVALSSMPSIVLALFLPKNVSAPPPMLPDRPACLPD